MPEILRHARGESALGPFLAVASDVGVVAFEFGGPSLVGKIRVRYPEAVISEDARGLADVVEGLRLVVDRPGAGHEIALDPRGSEYQRQVWSMLQTIPIGQTTSYGALAARMGTRDARDVTAAIASNAIAILIPCHRVVKKDGSLSGYRWGATRKRAILDREQAACTI